MYESPEGLQFWLLHGFRTHQYYFHCVTKQIAGGMFIFFGFQQSRFSRQVFNSRGFIFTALKRLVR